MYHFLNKRGTVFTFETFCWPNNNFFDLLLNTYAKFFKKLIFLPPDRHMGLSGWLSGCWGVGISENFANMWIGWHLLLNNKPQDWYDSSSLTLNYITK